MLQSLQKLLAVIYDVPVEHDVADFLLTDRSRLPESARASGAAEQVLVAEDGDTLWVSVYLEPALLQRLCGFLGTRVVGEVHVYLRRVTTNWKQA